MKTNISYFLFFMAMNCSNGQFAADTQGASSGSSSVVETPFESRLREELNSAVLSSEPEDIETMIASYKFNNKKKASSFLLFLISNFSYEEQLEIFNKYLLKIDIPSVDFSAQQLTEIPKIIFQIKTLMHLNLKENNITSIPEDIEKLTSLKTLNLSYNKIEKDMVIKLPKLQSLNVSHNKLKSFSLFLQEFKKLKSLNISHNEIEELSVELTYLECLQTLMAVNNSIKIIHPNLFTMSSLKRIILRGNNIQELPKVIVLPNLETLDLFDNLIKEIPESFRVLPALKILNLKSGITSDENKIYKKSL